MKHITKSKSLGFALLEVIIGLVVVGIVGVVGVMTYHAATSTNTTNNNSKTSSNTSNVCVNSDGIPIDNCTTSPSPSPTKATATFGSEYYCSDQTKHVVQVSGQIPRCTHRGANNCKGSDSCTPALQRTTITWHCADGNMTPLGHSTDTVGGSTANAQLLIKSGIVSTPVCVTKAA